MFKMGQELEDRLDANKYALLEALELLRRTTRDMKLRNHHGNCYGLDIEAHPDCELCKLISAERIADRVLAKIEGGKR